MKLIYVNDIVPGQHIGSEPTLPYLSPELTGQKLLVGANFASAGIGILNDTGIQFVINLPALLSLYLYVSNIIILLNALKLTISMSMYYAEMRTHLLAYFLQTHFIIKIYEK